MKFCEIECLVLRPLQRTGRKIVSTLTQISTSRLISQRGETHVRNISPAIGLIPWPNRRVTHFPRRLWKLTLVFYFILSMLVHWHLQLFRSFINLTFSFTVIVLQVVPSIVSHKAARHYRVRKQMHPKTSREHFGSWPGDKWWGIQGQPEPTSEWSWVRCKPTLDEYRAPYPRAPQSVNPMAPIRFQNPTCLDHMSYSS